MKNLFTTVIRFIKNTYKYRNFLKEDMWWDRHYIFLILREKLSEDLKMYKKHSYNAYPEPIIKSLTKCVLTLDRIIEDDYLGNALTTYEKKHPDWFLHSIENTLPDGNWFKRCCRGADLQKKQDIEYLFKIMSKHIDSWWD